ncbi:hypothetical protein [Nocardia sp. NPDC048505]|uniref:hypothetical protein n=1 Tax=unclassified Nocardia TaxID=2637762 RepID=UPI0033D8A3E4
MSSPENSHFFPAPVKIQTFHGMTPVSAVRMVERIFAGDVLIQSSLAELRFDVASHNDPGIIVPGNDSSDDNMPRVEPKLPPGYRHTPVAPNENGDLPAPYRYEKGPPRPEDQSGANDAGGGFAGGGGPSATGNAPTKPSEREAPSYPSNGADVGPPGVQPGTAQGAPYIHSDPGGVWDETYPRGNDVQIPAEHTLPDPLLPPTDHRQAQQNSPQSDGTGALDAPRIVPDLPQTMPKTAAPGADAPDLNMAPDLPPASNPANESPNSPDIGEPSFLESLIPFYGSMRQAIYDFQNGRWLMGMLNTAFAISDLFLIKSIFTVGGKLLWKLGQMLITEPAAIGKALSGMIAGVGSSIGSAVDRTKKFFSGMFGGAKESADEAAERARRELAEEQWKEAQQRLRLEAAERRERAGKQLPPRGRRKPVWDRVNDGFDDLRDDVQRAQDEISINGYARTRTHASAVFDADDGSKISARASSGKDDFLDDKNLQLDNAAREPVGDPNRYPINEVDGKFPSNDSEVKILEELRSKLRPDASGKLRIVVDRPRGDDMAASEVICPSCVNVLNYFKEEFPNIGIEVRDMYGRILFSKP